MSCRFPKATGTDEYWRLLMGNVDAITEVPTDRFDVAQHYDPAPETPGRTTSRYGGFLSDPYGFDAAFFGITPGEARVMDPQQRLLLQTAWEALEDAGIRPSALAGSRTGVFVGQATAEYGEAFSSEAGPNILEAAGSRLRAVSAGRVSYALDLRGPSVVLDTACSSSLVAVHTARQSLLTTESDLAVAAGTNLVFSATDAVAYAQASMLAPDGRCKFGDASADGFVRSDGIGAVVLKRLADAEHDKDPILALLVGSAVTNDGRGSGLLLQPAGSGQIAALRDACLSAGITPGQLDYVEAHGTGTRVGDHAELGGLARVMAEEQTWDRPLKVGSVKTNIGHAEAAAGIAALIKTVLIARHRTIPASLHVTTPNPLLTEDEQQIEVVRQNEDLKPGGEAALLGVSSFGISGTNAHVIVREYQQREPGVTPAARRPDEPHLLLLSARSKRSLRRLADRYAALLETDGSASALADICATAATRRDHHSHRLWAVGRSADELTGRLRAVAEGEEIADGGVGEAGYGGAKRIAFVFPGQGSQWLGMGRGLLAASPAFREALHACDQAVRAETGWSVVDALAQADEEILEDIAVVQPILWALEVALAAHWQAAGVRPDVCIGHSMGETAAACVAGALSVQDAAAVICRRSRLMKRLAGRGAMLAVGLPAAEARRLAADHGPSVCVAVENSPTSTVLAGEPEVLGRIADDLRHAGRMAREIKVSVASHSPAVDPVRDELLRTLEDLAPKAAHTSMLSTVSCTGIAGPELTAGYWADNLRETVRFADAVRIVAGDEETVFLELSPHPVLTTMIEETQTALGKPHTAIASLQREQDEAVMTLRALGRLFAGGGRVDWQRWAGRRNRPVRLPAYPWDEQPYRSRRTGAGSQHVRTKALGSLAGAVSVHGLPSLPPATLLSMALDAAEGAVGRPALLEDVQVEAPRNPRGGSDGTLRVAVDKPDPQGTHTVTMDVRTDGSHSPVWHARGQLKPLRHTRLADGRHDLDAALDRCRAYLGPRRFADLTGRWGYRIAPELLRVSQLWWRGGESIARVRFPSAPAPQELEAALLPVLAALPQTHAGSSLYVPTAFRRVALYGKPTADMWTQCRVARRRGEPANADIRLLDAEGRVLAEFRGITLHRRPAPAGQRRGVLRALTGSLPGAVARISALPTPDGPHAIDGTGAPVAPAMPLPAAPGPGARPEDGTSPEPAGDTLLECVAAVMETSPDAVEIRRSLRDLGIDSLMAARLNKLLLARTGVDVGVGRLLGNDTIAALREAHFPPASRP